VLLGVVLVFKDVTEQRRLSSEMLYRASHDALTGLINRFEFEAHLCRLLGASHQDDTEHALLYLDLDQFKIVNDVCGHAVGDRLLQQVARLLGNLVRASDMIARIGGDEFAILLEHCSLERAEWIAQQICDQMDQFRFVHDERRFRVGTSIGLVPIDARWTTPAQILAAADTCCYAAKEDGRNRTRTWLDSDLAIRVRHGEMQWTSRIENALDEDRFVLYAQRIHPLGPRRDDVHAEVLLRLPDADGSLVLPGAFLPAAERFGLASRIDRCVLAKVLAWLANARDADRIENLCVNLSGQSVGDRNFHQWAVEALRAAGPAICAKLCFEVTETSAVTSLADAAAFIDHVHALNIRVALDDFGAGASSFGYLKTMPVDFLKIDGQFVSNVVESALDEATVRCFIDIAAVVNVKTVAEMVSSAAVLERLVRLGVDYVQGFFMDRPAPIDELLTGGAFAADGRNR
jgi:diguanylate cyclase (GGDEF)-like protein